MKLRKPTLLLIGALLQLSLPLPAPGADALTVTAEPAVGSQSVSLTGTAPAGQALEATLFARYSKDLPTVLLSRRQLSSDAQGHYAATLSMAPAFFRKAIVTIAVRALPAGPTASASLAVGEPNVATPADEFPSSVR